MAAALPWSRWHQLTRLVLGSRRRGPLVAPPGVLAAWRQRLQRVRGLLAREPQAAMSWYWRAHERVLDFMVRRYASTGSTARSVEESLPEARDVPVPPSRPPAPRTLPAELVPAAAPQRSSPDPQMIEWARSHLLDIAGANLAADKPPPPVFVAPPRRPAILRPLPIPRPVTWRRDKPLPLLTAGLVVGAMLLQVPIVLAGIALGRSIEGVGIALAIVVASIVAAIGHRVRHTKTDAAVASGPLRTCPRCAYDLSHIRRGRCPECGQETEI